MSFYTKTTLRAECPEFVANLKQSPATGVWGAEINFKSGKREVYSYASESKMRTDLKSRSAFEVKFIKSNSYSDKQNSEVENAKAAMLASNPRAADIKNGLAKAPEVPKVTPLQAAGYSLEEEDAILQSCYATAVSQREWYLRCEENKQTVFRCLSDNGYVGNVENFGNVIDHLYKNNYLIRATRKRGDEPVKAYVSPSAAPQERRAEEMSFAELQAIEQSRQQAALRKARATNPVLNNVATKRF
jgi:hypothetical protein